MTTVQYRVALAKKQEAVEGPDDADVVITIGKDDVALDPAVAYMRGKLKATGHTGVLLDALKDPATASTLRRLAR